MEENQEGEVQKSSVNPMVIGGIFVLVLVVLVGGYLLLGRGAQENVLSETQEVAEEIEAILPGDSEVQIIEVEGGSFYFEPNEIRVKKGDTVRVRLNAVSLQHDFVIDELGVQSEIVPVGESGEVQFEAVEAGEYEFYCSIGNHRAEGMVGTLIVEDLTEEVSEEVQE